METNTRKTENLQKKNNKKQIDSDLSRSFLKHNVSFMFMKTFVALQLT